MPRQLVEELQGYRFGVSRREIPAVGDPAAVAGNGHEPAQTAREETVIELVDVQPSHVHVIRIPLTEEAREELVRQLTGGIEIARQLPPLAP